MQNYSFPYFTYEEHKKILQKQEKWRQKQINIFFRTGKPIFTMTMENMHMRRNNNPYYYVDNEKRK